MAKHLIDAGRTLEARDEAARVVRVRPAMTDAKATFALASYLCGETDTARDVLEQLRADAPDDPRVRAYLSLLERDQGARP
jgi:Flp pilus assembly protein TadD